MLPLKTQKIPIMTPLQLGLMFIQFLVREDFLMNIPGEFGYNWSNGFGEDY